jgi:hypothetical protein
VFGIFQQLAINAAWEKRKAKLATAGGASSEVIDVIKPEDAGVVKKEKMGDVNVEVIKLD